MTSVAVVILNYNGEKLLRQFLPSVLRYSSEATIYVADNGSSDSSVAMMRSEFPFVNIIELNNNFGFCGGYNRALAKISADYYVLLNSDVEVTEGWLDPLKRRLDVDPNVAAIQPKILSYRQRDLFEYAGAGGGFIDSFGYPFCRGRLFNEIEKDRGQYDDEREIFWSSGACMMIRASDFHAHAGFDESYFAHMEEIDLCWKINRGGKRIWYSGKSVVYHVGASTLQYESPHKTYLNFRNNLCTVIKHMYTSELLVKIPLRVILDWIAAIVFLLRGQGKNAASVLDAHASVCRSIGDLSRKRRLIRKVNHRYRKDCIYRGLVLIYFYLLRRRTSPL